MITEFKDDKQKCVIAGNSFEEQFVSSESLKYGLQFVLNPNRFAPYYEVDLICVKDGLKDELKCQRTPKYLAKRYNIDPQFAVSFNVKDFLRYAQFKPRGIYFWTQWQDSTRFGVSIRQMDTVHRVLWSVLSTDITAGKYPTMEPYKDRKGDSRNGFDSDGNAAVSYLLDLQKFEKLEKVAA